MYVLLILLAAQSDETDRLDSLQCFRNDTYVGPVSTTIQKGRVRWVAKANRFAASMPVKTARRDLRRSVRILARRN